MAHSIKKTRGLALLACAATLSMTAAACGSSSGGGGGGGGTTGNTKGPITFVTGKDNSGVWAPTVATWNKAHPKEKITIKEQTDEADQQHDDIVQHMQAKDPAYDLVTVDVIWTAEFAAQGWLVPLEGDYAMPTNGLLKPTVDAATYNNKLYAAPFASDGGLLYYRTDLVKTPPKTLDEMWGMCKIAKQNNIGCYSGQFAKYEGLTVNAAEAINTMGGQIVDAAGKPTVDSAESVAALKMLADHFKNGDIPRQSITYTEEEGRIEFQKGQTLFHRNWPYVYGLAATEGSSKVKGKFDVAPLPGADGPGASSLGGHSIGISSYSDHKATALAFLKFIEEPTQQKFFMEKGSLAPVLENIYTDKALVKNFPYLPTLKTSIENAVPRPVTPYYPAVTKAIQDNSFAAIKGEVTAEQAIKDMQAAMKTASSGG